ncbi:MAG TPA: ATP-dependent Clp protease ATP-binding subunit, partial [Patescibacteria group bacterium]|nr:ATP-dependent Clp protease ATP-binding subunit [Patescibacteria group bacterium]
NPVLSVEAQKTLLQAYREAYLSNKDKVDIPEIILALAEPSDCRVTEERDDVEEILVDYDLNYQKMKNVVAWIRIQEELRSNLQRYRGRAKYKPKSGLDRAMTAVATPFLDKFSDDLTLQAKYGHFFPCIGREEEFEKIFRITQGSRQGVMLIGHQGVGRTTIIQGLAQRMVSEDVPEELQDKRLVNLKVSSLLAGVDAAGAEQRLLVIADEVIRSGNIILVVEDIHNLHGITAGGQSSLDLSEVFAEVMGKHLFLTIATTYPQEYSQAIEGRSLDAVFQNIKVDELEINQAIQVLEAKSGPIEYQNSLYFSYDAIEQAALLSARYIHDRYLPDKAIEILEQVAVKVKKTRGEKSLIKGEDVAEVISEMTGIPLTKVTEKESEKLLNLEDRIHERMVDQEEAVKAVASGIRRARAELREGKRPISSMLFLGPTGVGKTELAKTVSEVYFGSEESMIRLDMSEYQNQASLVRLIGHGREAGYLTEKVRKNPFALLLFDEVEKAHPDILNIFLQVLDDGRLTDAQGRTIDFTNTIIIMTSNAGAQYIQDEINKGTEVDKIKDYLINEKLKQHFRPEFLNRFDGVVVFKPLSMVDVIKIAKLMVNKISRRLEEKGIEFSATEAAIAELAESGFDPKFGARPLRRTIQTKVDDVLADYLLKGEISRRDKVVLEVGGKLNIEKAKKL